ncbi:hypothetical protein O7632_14310 [Solwaraspora sp. WMMD406]|uniref:hypothetical protein n=1 Tax=Solwaraspora sp. WMMD406 TaxID=3016095 RepID=UPI002417377B|nr:hypothetical protein [Solwaraspora sp. WMMD406]MDG4765260.1 hypothetical protein [Solwaraspora sp. WMMD406]
MPPSADLSGGAVVVQAMRRYGFERLLDLPALPVGGADPLRYGHHAPARHGRGGWQLRGVGTEFDLLRPGWLRIGLTRGYSLGWGLGGDGSGSTVLLAQAVDPTSGHTTNETAADGLARLGQELETVLAGHGVAGVWTVGAFRRLACLRFAADLGGTPLPLGPATAGRVASTVGRRMPVVDREVPDA